MYIFYRGESFDSNFYYYSGLDIDHAFLLVGKSKILFVPALNEAFAKANFPGRVVVYSDPFDKLSNFVKGKTVCADFSSLAAATVKKLEKYCSLKDATAEIIARRSVKRKDEIAKIRKAAQFTREIFHSLDFSAGTELDIEKQIRMKTIELGLEPAFDPIVATDSSTSYPHYRARKKKLGSLVMVDYGVKYGHYCSDLTRCFLLQPTKKQRQEYETLQNICYSIIDELPNLKCGKDVAGFAEKQMEKAGFPHLIHSIGHGIGLDVHEYPGLGFRSKARIAGATMAIEPAFYYEKYGMRFEETVYHDGKKAKIL
ncbi:aminopeptidase P family protein [Candidatus Micrarchaeota archaeon]|nr:aminopeptidase P family protein [Candidatus Micrarchaeota archaeon]